MNILFLSELFYPHGGGAELAAYLYANLLSNSDFNVTVITNRFDGEPRLSRRGNLRIHRLHLFEKSKSVKYSILKRFDVLLSSFTRKMINWADVICIPRFWYSAIPLAKIYKKPVVAQLHDYIPVCPLSNIYDLSKDTICHNTRLLCPPRCIYAYEKTQGKGFFGNITSMSLNSTLRCYFGKLVEFSDALICVSRLQREMIIDRAPYLRDKTFVIHNPLPELSHIEMKGDDFGYFGGPNYLKGFNTLYQAAILMRKANQSANTQTKIHATKFFEASTQLHESPSNLGILLYGKLEEDGYKKLYGQIRAVIVPSIWHEPWPYVVVEAIIGGRFVVASRVGGIPEQLEGCKGALLCEPGNPRQLAEAIESVKCLNRETIVELGSQSRETFLKRFNNETTIKSFSSVCDSLV